MKLLSIIFMTALFFSCGVKKNSQSNLSDPKSDELVAEIGNLNQESENFKIISARLDKNKLILSVEFSGGCESFSGRLIGAEFLMKSLPPKRNIKFFLNKQGDCRELKTKQFVFDISELAYKKEKGSEIILLLEGYSEPISYSFD